MFSDGLHPYSKFGFRVRAPYLQPVLFGGMLEIGRILLRNGNECVVVAAGLRAVEDGTGSQQHGIGGQGQLVGQPFFHLLFAPFQFGVEAVGDVGDKVDKAFPVFPIYGKQMLSVIQIMGLY